MNTLKPKLPAVRPDAVREALAQAREWLGGAPPELVLVNDPQRATSTPVVLAAARGFFDLTAARVLVATGSHRFSPEKRYAFERAFAGIPLRAWDWHDARRADLADIGVGGAGGWRGHPWLAQARTVLAIGSVEPHYFAGFTGAHKTLTVGCAAYADIERNHAGALASACRPCRLTPLPVTHQSP